MAFTLLSSMTKEEKRDMLAVVFPSNEIMTAVFDMKLLAEGNITFGQNSWRGDHYDAELHQATEKWSKR